MRIIVALLLFLIYSTNTVFGRNNKVTKYVTEESPKGTVVANIARILSLRYEELAEREFKILNQKLVTKNPPSSKKVVLVTLDENTSVMKLAEKIDREKICKKAEECIIEIQVVVLPQPYFTLIKMDLIVVDINDNPPRIPTRKINITLTEGDTFINDVINIDRYRAQDKDVGLNGEILYTLSKNPYFAIVQYEDEAGISHLGLKVLKVPDHELEAIHSLTLHATDRGEISLTDYVPAYITIEDSNDHDPVFEQKEYSVYLKESTRISSLIATVRATDRDSGDYGRVRYSLAPSTLETTEQLVYVDPINGEVKLKKKLNKDTHDGIRIMIRASDSDPLKPRTGHAWLLIHVEDVNDNTPVINVDFITQARNHTGYILESSTVETFLAYVSATDEDEGSNGKVNIKIKTFAKKKQAKYYKEVPGEFVLRSDSLLATGRLLDRETYQKYLLEIAACDEGSPSKCAANNYTIVVLDENDNSPIFDTPHKTVVIPEDSKVGTLVTTVTAFDADSTYQSSLWLQGKKISTSQNGVLTYSVVKGDTTIFRVDESSGYIRLKKPLDHEKQNTWKLVVNAKDGGMPEFREANCTVTIRVRDINDNRPMFKFPSKNGTDHYSTILKDQPIMILKAQDQDKGINSRIIYKITEEDGIKLNGHRRPNGLFIVNPISGSLRLNFSKPNLTNYLGWHTLKIKASDSAASPLSTSVYIEIKVIDKPLPDPLAQASFEPKLIIVVTVLAIASLVLVVLIIVTLLRRRKKRQLQTYSCKTARTRTKLWVSLPGKNKDEGNMSRDSDPKIIWDLPITENSYEKSSTSRHDSDARRFSLDVENSKVTSCDSAPAKISIASLSLPVVRSIDLDSGRGDSGSENDNNEYEVLERATRNQASTRARESFASSQPLQEELNTSKTSDLGPRCKESCREYGHSDTCWLPSPSRDTYCPPSIPCNDSLRYTAESPTSSQSFYYNCIDYKDNRVSEQPRNTSGDRYSVASTEYYHTMPTRSEPPAELYYHGYESELETIEEGAPFGVQTYQGVDTYDVDDVSNQTHYNLSTSVYRSPDVIRPIPQPSSRSNLLFYIAGHPRGNYSSAPSLERHKYRTIPCAQRTQITEISNDSPLRYCTTFRPLAPSPGSQMSYISSSSTGNNSHLKYQPYHHRASDNTGIISHSQSSLIAPQSRTSLSHDQIDNSYNDESYLQETQKIVSEIDKFLEN